MVRRFASEKHLQTLHGPSRVDEDYLRRIENCGLIERDSRQALRMQKLQLWPISSRENESGHAREDGRLIDFNSDRFGLGNVFLVVGMRLFAWVYHREPHLASRDHSMQ